MKLNCGPTYEERYATKMERLKNWHPCFCLIPRRIDGTNQCRWLETVERRGVFECGYTGSYWEWQYREIRHGYSD